MKDTGVLNWHFLRITQLVSDEYDCKKIKEKFQVLILHVSQTLA